MSRLLTIAIEEELEIEKLLSSEKRAKQSSEYDALYHKVKVDVEIKREQAASEEPEDGSEGVDTETTDETSGEAQNTSPDASEDDVSVESFKNLQYDRVSLEDFGEAPSITGKIFHGIKTLANHIGDGLTYLYEIGVAHGPELLSKLYRGVLYVFGKLAKLLVTSIITLDKYIARRNSSFSSIKKNITSLRETLKLVKEKDQVTDLSQRKYTSQKNINRLKIGDNLDLSKNIDSMNSFLSLLVRNLDAKIKDEIGSIKHLIAFSSSGSIKSPLSFMSVKPVNIGLTHGDLEAYKVSSEVLTSYVYKEVLPGDLVFIAHLPVEELNSLDDATKAYNSSSLFFGISTESYREINAIDYMTTEQLDVFIDSLDKLCDVCIAHQTLYEDVKRIKSTMKYSIKNYFMSVASSENKMSLEASLVEYIYLKSMFIDKVYLTAAMDVHDLSAKLLTAGLAYAKDNISKL